jgi:hypothetical protein
MVVDGWLALTRNARTVFGRQARWRDVWRLLPGDLLGLVVMRGCGIVRPTRDLKVGAVTVLVVEDPLVRRWFRAQLIPVRAQTLGRFILAREPVPDELLEHEIEHVRQWSVLGPLYLPLYFAASAAALVRGRRPYWDNWFEAAARRRAELEMAAVGALRPAQTKTRLKP